MVVMDGSSIVCVCVCALLVREATRKGLAGRMLLFTGCFTLVSYGSISLSHSPSVNKSKEHVSHTVNKHTVLGVYGMFHFLPFLDEQHQCCSVNWVEQGGQTI